MPRPNYPMLLDISSRLCVIIGGGEVARRKAAGLVDAAATRVRVIAPEFRGEFPQGVEKVSARFAPEHLDGATLVFAATDDPEINGQIVRQANIRGMLVCRADADEDDPGDFATLAKLQNGPVIVGVSAVSPALALHIRGKIEEIWRPGWSLMAEFMQQLRPRLIARGLPIAQRRAIFRDLASEEAIDFIEHLGNEKLMQWLAVKHPEVNDA